MRPKPLLALLESVAGQSVYPDEILIIDGSENNETIQVLTENSFENLKYFKVDNNQRGLTKQRNFGIERVSETMDIVCFLDDDTILDKEYFKNVISKDEIYWSKPYRSNISGDEMITISIKGDDHYLFVHMDLEYLDYVYHQVINRENKKELIILDEFGIIIYDSSSINDDLHLPLYDFQKYKAQNTEELFDFDYEKSNYIATHVTYFFCLINYLY